MKCLIIHHSKESSEDVIASVHRVECGNWRRDRERLGGCVYELGWELENHHQAIEWYDENAADLNLRTDGRFNICQCVNERDRTVIVENPDAQIRTVDSVMMFLMNHKEDVIETLFGGANEDYLEEWRSRDLFGFWCHLDLGNRKALVKMALRHYAQFV